MKYLKLFLFLFTLFVSVIACSMGGKPSINRPLFKSLFYMGDSVGTVYKKECPGGKRHKNGTCKKALKKVVVDMCKVENFNEFKRERYILIKESDFLH